MRASGFNVSSTMFNDYTVKDGQRFQVSHYPAIEKELTGLHGALLEARELYKIEIIISFVKYHSLKMEWVNGNKEAAKMLTSGSLAISNLESLFNSSRNNQQFTNDLEAYIKLRFAFGTEPVTTAQTLHPAK